MAPRAQNLSELIQKYIREGRPSDWFELIYAQADGHGQAVPWASLGPSPDLIEWLERHDLQGRGQQALVVACGLGDDAEALAQRGFAVTAFDISPTAINWCRQRFPDSSVDYQVVDLFQTPPAWQGCFGFVLEYFTIQALPPECNEQTIRAVAQHVAPGGTLLVICLGREADVTVDGPPWPLSKQILNRFKEFGLTEMAFEEYGRRPDSAVYRFRAEYRRPGPF